VLALTFRHGIADRRSGTELLRRVLGRIANESVGDIRPAAPLPPMHAVFPARFRRDEQPEAAEQVYAAVMHDCRRHGKPARLLWLGAGSPRRVPRLQRTTLEPDDLQLLLAACRRHGTTLHGALCAAQLRATYWLQSTTEPAALFLSCPVDLRPRLDPVQPIAPTCLYVTLLGASFVLDPSTTFWDLVRGAPAHTRTQLARGDGHLFFSLYGLDRAVADADALARFGKYDTGKQADATAQALGEAAHEQLLAAARRALACPRIGCASVRAAVRGAAASVGTVPTGDRLTPRITANALRPCPRSSPGCECR